MVPAWPLSIPVCPPPLDRLVYGVSTAVPRFHTRNGYGKGTYIPKGVRKVSGQRLQRPHLPNHSPSWQRRTGVSSHLPVIPFGSYNLSAPTYKEVICTHSLPSFAKYPLDHPQISFNATHMRHCMKLMGEWKLQPFAPIRLGSQKPSHLRTSCESAAQMRR
jgi:hypothetical protein